MKLTNRNPHPHAHSTHTTKKTRDAYICSWQWNQNAALPSRNENQNFSSSLCCWCCFYFCFRFWFGIRIALFCFICMASNLWRLSCLEHIATNTYTHSKTVEQMCLTVKAFKNLFVRFVRHFFVRFLFKTSNFNFGMTFFLRSST